jgi:hypothetical protein
MNKKHINKTNRETVRKKKEHLLLLPMGPAHKRRTKEVSDGEILLVFNLASFQPYNCGTGGAAPPGGGDLGEGGTDGVPPPQERGRIQYIVFVKILK